MGARAALLGVDGGGTSTIAWLTDGDGAVVGRGASGASNAKAVGDDAAREALDAAIAGAFDDAGAEPTPVAVACLGLAGFDRPDDKERLEGWAGRLRWADRLVLVNDGDLVIAAGTPDGWGVGVIAGTGSIAVGRAPDGRAARAGGWGPLFGDEGSAYKLALDSLRLIARAADGRDPRGPAVERLSDQVCRALGAPDPTGLVSAVYAPGVDRTRIAALAPVVLEAIGTDPDLLERIVAPAATALSETIVAVAAALRFDGDPPAPLALAGGFLIGATGLRRRLLDDLRTRGAPVDLENVAAVPEPVAGAVRLALRASRS